MWLFLLYFLLGIVQDGLITLYNRCVYLQRARSAAALSLIITVLALIVAKEYITTDDNMLLYGYAVGTAVGTYLAMKIRIGKPKHSPSIQQ